MIQIFHHHNDNNTGAAIGTMAQADSQTGSEASRSDPVHQTRIFVVDDHPAIREVLSSAFEEKSDMDVVGGCSTAEKALPRIRDLAPDVVVVDISLEETDGLTLIERIREQIPEARILVFSMCDENVYADQAIHAGASGYVMKSKPISEVVRAIEEVGQGRVFLSRPVMSRIIRSVIQANDNYD